MLEAAVGRPPLPVRVNRRTGQHRRPQWRRRHHRHRRRHHRHHQHHNHPYHRHQVCGPPPPLPLPRLRRLLGLPAEDQRERRARRAQEPRRRAWENHRPKHCLCCCLATPPTCTARSDSACSPKRTSAKSPQRNHWQRRPGRRHRRRCRPQLPLTLCRPWRQRGRRRR